MKLLKTIALLGCLASFSCNYCCTNKHVHSTNSSGCDSGVKEIYISSESSKNESVESVLHKLQLDKEPKNNVKIYINCDEKVSFKYITELIDRLKAEGYKNIFIKREKNNV